MSRYAMKKPLISILILVAPLMVAVIPGVVNAEIYPDSIRYSQSLRISPPPPGPYVSLKIAAVYVPQYITGSYRPMTESMLKGFKQSSVMHRLDQKANIYHGPSSSEVYGISVDDSQAMKPIDSPTLLSNRSVYESYSQDLIGSMVPGDTVTPHIEYAIDSP